jgi:predicted ribonuclease YlaK
MEFIDIEKGAKLVNKSVSTIKRMIATVKKNNPKDYQNKDFFKFEILATGHKKVFINVQYLSDYFNSSNGSTKEKLNGSMNDSMNSSTQVADPELFKKMIEILEKELDTKNKQIDALNERLRESNILALENTKKNQILLEENPKKRKWWQI